MIARKLLVCALMVTLAGAAPGDQAQPLTMTVAGLRSTKGRILACLTRSPDHFPDCSGDSTSRHFNLPATGDVLALGLTEPGDYAISIIHDENGNGRLDTFAGIPREGVGFSRNPVLRFGAPRFESARFSIGGAPVRQDIRVKYFL